MSAVETRPRSGGLCLADRIYPEVRSMFEGGQSQNEIAKALGVSQATVGRSLSRNDPDRPGATTSPKPTMQTLYRMFDADGQLLYVGISVNPMSRMKHHASAQPWWEEVSGIDLEKYATRDQVMEAERRAVENENPRYNVRLRPDRDVPHEERARRSEAGRKGGIKSSASEYNRARGAKYRIRTRQILADCMDGRIDEAAQQEDEALVAEWEDKRKKVAA